MQTYEPNGFGDRLHIDLTGPHPPSRQGSIYILTAIDAYTRFLKNKMAVTVADALVERVLLPFGCFRSLVSDQGPEFCNELLAEVTARLGIQKLRTTAYRASANGRVERVHRTMNNLISKHIGENQKMWQDSLQTIVTAYNASVHESTNYSPYYLVYGREYRTPLDLTIATPEIPVKNQWDYTDQLETRLQAAYESVNQHLKATTQRMKIRYDARVKPLTLEAGDFAHFYYPRRRRGRYHKWARLCILCRVERKINDVLYLIRIKPKGRTSVVHVDRLKVFQGEVPALWKDSIIESGERQAEPHDREAVGREAVQSTVRPCPTAEVDSNQYQGSSSHSADTGQQDNKARLEPVSDKPAGHASAGEGRCQKPNSLRATPQSPPYKLRSPPQRSLPARFRCIQTANFETNGRITMESSKTKCNGRTEAQKKRRHERNKGPWACGLCEHEPFGSITGFRNHTIIEHKFLDGQRDGAGE
jgi:hypothetical protein